VRVGVSLTQAISNLNGTDSYGYDPAGHRVWKQGPDSVTHVYYNGPDGKPLADFSFNPQTEQVQGGSPMLYFAGKRVDNAAVEDRLETAVIENGHGPHAKAGDTTQGTYKSIIKWLKICDTSMP
jgi:hypothetical protein